MTALVIDTRPVWASGIAGSDLQPVKHPSISYIAAPLQTLRGLPQDRLLRQWSELKSSTQSGSDVLALVATSPGSVEALQAMPVLSHEMAKGLLREQPALFAVGAGSASCLATWAKSYGQGLQVLWPAQASGVEAFLQMFQTRTDLSAHDANTLFVLLESTANQPDLALGLHAMGLQAVRFGVYERMDCSLELPPSVAASLLVCVVVSSSALVDRAVDGLTRQGLVPQQAHWFCHHTKIMASFKKASLPLLHQLTDLTPSRIIAKVIELSRMND